MRYGALSLLFVALSFILNSSCTPKANADDKSIAHITKACIKDTAIINPKNHQFTKILDSCASKVWGDEEKTTQCLISHFKDLSKLCATCFGQTAACTAKNCKIKCIFDHFSAGCLDCVNKNCREEGASKFSLVTCSGLKKDQLVPTKP